MLQLIVEQMDVLVWLNNESLRIFSVFDSRKQLSIRCCKRCGWLLGC